MLIANGGFTAGTNLHIVIKYEWCASPGNQYTAKVYSKMNANMLNDAGNTYMVHMDGNQPSGYTSS